MWCVPFDKCHVHFPSTGVKKGDRISIYMPMILELVVAMLACTRIGALHSVVVGRSPLCCSRCWALWGEQLLFSGEELERWVLTMRWMETKLRCCCFLALFCINCGTSSFSSLHQCLVVLFTMGELHSCCWVFWVGFFLCPCWLGCVISVSLQVSQQTLFASGFLTAVVLS